MVARARVPRGCEPGSDGCSPYTALYLDTLLHVPAGPTRDRLSRAERQAQTRAALLDAAERTFVERGFLGASVEAITEAAGYTRGAFYSNFESKEQLFAELLQDRVYARYRRMATATPDAEPPLAELGRRLADIQADTDGRWLFQLWLELLAHAGRD